MMFFVEVLNVQIVLFFSVLFLVVHVITTESEKKGVQTREACYCRCFSLQYVKP